MSYQFFHVESYAREAGKGKAGGHTSKSILAEAKREIDACPHVKNSLAPTVLFGNLDEVEDEAKNWADSANDAIGRKLRKDGHCLLGGVFSAPDEMTASDWANYRVDAVEWLRERYGERLRCVIEHKDEDKRHCHFYAVPKQGERFEVLHPGKAAALAAKAEGKKKGEQNRAYCEAMREFQTEFWKVSRNYGLARHGPKKRRLTRAEWKTEKMNARLVRDVKEESEAKEAKAAEQTKLWNKATAECKRERAELQKESASIEENKRFFSSIGGKFGAFFGGVKIAYKRATARLKKMLPKGSIEQQLEEKTKLVEALEQNARVKTLEVAKTRHDLEKAKEQVTIEKRKAETAASIFVEHRELVNDFFINKKDKTKEKSSEIIAREKIKHK